VEKQRRPGAARRLWLNVHLWIALVVACLLALLGLSGSLLVLRAPLLAWEVGPGALHLAAPPAPDAVYATPEAWTAAARTAYPQFSQIYGALPPRSGFLPADNAIVFGSVHGREGIGVAMIDPYTAESRVFFLFNDLWLAKIVVLHRALLLPPPLAAPVMVGCGVCLLISLVTGLWLWWPRGSAAGRWRRALTLRRHSRGLLRWRELHNVAASWLFIPLALLTLSGLWLAAPSWFSRIGLALEFKPVISVIHAELGIGHVGEVITFLTGLALPVLYVSGLLMWWKKRRARHGASQRRQRAQSGCKFCLTDLAQYRGRK